MNNLTQQLEDELLAVHLEKLNQAKIELETSIAFLEHASKEPRRFLMDAKEMLGSTHNLLFKALDTPIHKKKEHPRRDLHLYIASKMNAYMQEWKEQREISADVRIQVRTPNSFPSIFCVYYEDMEIIQFNIFEMWYGVRILPITEEDTYQQYQQNKEDCIQRIKQAENGIKQIEELINHRYKLIKHPRNLVILFYSKDKVREKLESTLHMRDVQKKSAKKELEKYEEYLPILIENGKKRNKAIEMIRPFFEELNYTIQKETGKLY